MPARRWLLGLLGGLGVGLSMSGALHAAGEVTSLSTSERPGTPFRYVHDGTEYTWGLGNNLLLEGFSSEGRQFGYALKADRVELRRDDVEGAVDGGPCGVFVERMDETSTQLAADYPGNNADAALCDMAELLRSRVLNRGTLDLFSNRMPDAKNIERVDYLFDSGILAPVTPQGLASAGHVVAEKGGNNRVKIAAVLSLDVLGQPASYGPLVLVRDVGCMDPRTCFGTTDLTHNYAFFRNDAIAPQGFPGAGRQSTESVTMAFVSDEKLGLGAGQRYFGFSLFADDVNTDDQDLLDPSTFPDDTQDEQIAPGDAADVYGGLSGYFIDDALSNGVGRVFLDEDGDGLPTDGEAGIAAMQIQLYRDTDGNGMFDPALDEPVCNATDTDLNGGIVLPGLPDGDYFAVVRENDPDLPAGLQLGAGTNPLPFSITGNDIDNLYFPFAGGVDGVGTGTNGATDSGDDDGDGSVTAGSTDAGGADAGGADAGGADAGGADAGSADAGGADAGGADAGGADAGGTDAGAVDAGGTDAGAVDAGGADAGAVDAGGADAGAVDAGSVDAGGVDAGGVDAGSIDADGVDAGSTDAGGADAGGVDAGAVDAGVDAGETTGSSTPDPGASSDDPTTQTMPDRFDVLQGESATVDVVANDNDGPDGGLSLIRVADTPNATIEIIDNEIVYTPLPSFYGTDSFVYEIRDAVGTEVSGTAVANVIRYSDINGNQINDFAECECTNLTLETGVHGSGVGRPSSWLLIVLASALLLSARRRQLAARGPTR